MCPALVVVAGLGIQEAPLLASDSAVSVWAAVADLVKVVWGAARNPQIARPMAWIFIASSLPPSYNSALFHFITDELGISPEVQSASQVVLWAIMFVATLGYKAYADSSATGTVFFWGQLGMALCALPTIALVLRWNAALGILGVYFMLATDAVATVVSRVYMMRFLVLAAKLSVFLTPDRVNRAPTLPCACICAARLRHAGTAERHVSSGSRRLCT